MGSAILRGLLAATVLEVTSCSSVNDQTHFLSAPYGGILMPSVSGQTGTITERLDPPPFAIDRIIREVRFMPDSVALDDTVRTYEKTFWFVRRGYSLNDQSDLSQGYSATVRFVDHPPLSESGRIAGPEDEIIMDIISASEFNPTQGARVYIDGAGDFSGKSEINLLYRGGQSLIIRAEDNQNLGRDFCEFVVRRLLIGTQRPLNNRIPAEFFKLNNL